MNRGKRQPAEWEEITANYSSDSDDELIPGIHKEFKHLTAQNK
jgi:hypothetical protein